MNHNIFISAEDELIIRQHLEDYPNVDFNNLEQTIKDYQKEILIENNKYLTNMDNLHYQQSLLDKKSGLDDDTLASPKYTRIFHDKTMEITRKHEILIKQITEDLSWCFKLKKIYLQLHPPETLSPRRLYAKTNTVLRKSFEKLLNKPIS
jgi:hypothetical protein